jgi:hypothetical protein
MDGSAMLLCLLLPVAARCRSLLTISCCCLSSNFFPVRYKYRTKAGRQKLEDRHHFPRRYRAAAVVRRRCKVLHEGNVEHVDVAEQAAAPHFMLSRCLGARCIIMLSGRSPGLPAAVDGGRPAKRDMK